MENIAKKFEIEKFLVQETMIRFGGEFIKCLGYALAHADFSNSQKIREAFADYWDDYLERYRNLSSEAKREINQGFSDDC